jgi:predicted DNA-binding protein (MmcQ/YjbR family)
VPDTADLAERLRELALSFPETYEDEPWGHPVFKVGDNSMFASMSVAEECVRLTVKLTPEEREIAQLLPYVSTARYVGRYGWVTAEVADDESLEAALEWLRESYWLKAPTSLRHVVEAWDEDEAGDSQRSRSDGSSA